MNPDAWQGAGTICVPNPCFMPPEMVLIPAGGFVMGSPVGERGRISWKETQHEVTLTKAMYVSTYEVTQAEWQAAMGWNESGSPGGNKPAAGVTWFDAVSYCNQLSVGNGYTPAYTITGVTRRGNHINYAAVAWDQTANGYRLLTEAEWEYACRAGNLLAFCNGDIVTPTGCLDPNLNLVGWYDCNASNTTHDRGGQAANDWGLHDMHGNVSEWCWDFWDGSDYPPGSATDPRGLSTGSSRTLRGGHYSQDAHYCRSACRSSGFPSNYRYDIGVRLARTVQ